MRIRILTLALALPFAACMSDAEEEAYEEGIPPGDREDVIGDGEIFDEPGEVEGNAFLDYDGDADGFISTEEYETGFGDGNMAAYDTDGDGMISMEEYDAYMMNNPGMDGDM
jgi:hypothetical protein